MFTVVLALLGGWWNTMPPSNDRDWQPEVARLPEATIEGELVILHNIRDFDYRSYNTLTTNCTNVIFLHTRVNPGHPPFSWKILLSGYAPEYAYETGRLDRSLPFEELRRR